MRNEVDPVSNRIKTVVERDRKRVDKRIQRYKNEDNKEQDQKDLKDHISCMNLSFHFSFHINLPPLEQPFIAGLLGNKVAGAHKYESYDALEDTCGGTEREVELRNTPVENEYVKYLGNI